MPVNIAIDGPSGAGKSTVSRAVAKKLGFLYVDTGAIYRTVGLWVARNGKNPENEAEVKPLLSGAKINMTYNEKGQRLWLNGEDVSEAIRTPEASRNASKVSALPCVRTFLLDMQRRIAAENDCIMDGRDIGTVVLPKADLKLFLTASAEDRARRRTLELEERGTPQKYESVLADIEERDERDKNRPIAPLKQAEDAILFDTTGNTLEQSVQAVFEICRKAIEK